MALTPPKGECVRDSRGPGKQEPQDTGGKDLVTTDP